LERVSHLFQSGPFTLFSVFDLPDAVARARATGGAPPKVPAVILCHGFTGSHVEWRRMYARLGERLARRGIACFRFDHRGCGNSDGDFIDFTPTGMIEDLDSALDAFLAQPWLDRGRMAIVGYSLGGLNASYILSKCGEFRTAVYWAPVAKPTTFRDRLSQQEGFENYRKLGYHDLGGFRVNRAYIDYVAELTNPIQWAAGYAGPILFIHGADDDIVRPEQTDRYLATRGNAGDRKIIIAGADHTFSTADNIDRVLDESESWLADHLAAPAANGAAKA
jgi:uncharacterized protein